MTADAVRREEVEALFFEEAALLDAWRLDDWLGLLTVDARYLVPPNDVPDGDPRDTLFTIADDIRRIHGRVKEAQERRGARREPALAHAAHGLQRPHRRAPPTSSSPRPISSSTGSAATSGSANMSDATATG